MSIDLNKAEFVWHANFPNGDFLGAVEVIDEGWALKYRFRYVLDDKVWDSKDKKNWYEFRSRPGGPVTIDEMIKAADEIFTAMTFLTKMVKLDFRGKELEEKMEILTQQEFANVKHFDRHGKEILES